MEAPRRLVGITNPLKNVSFRGAGKRPCDNEVCGKILDVDNRSYCSQCKVVVYCNKDCQTQHWQKHKSACKMFVSHPKKDLILEVRQMMHIILEASKEFIEEVFELFKHKQGIVVCDTAATAKEDNTLEFRFLELADLSKKCHSVMFQYVAEWTANGKRVFGMLCSNKVIDVIIYSLE